MLRTARGTPKHLSKTGKLNGFTYLMLNLPFRCNYRCSKCFDLGKRREEHAGGGAPLTFRERKELIKEARSLGGRVVVIAGEGEPSLEREMRPLVSGINSLGMIPVIYSNGSTLDPGLASFYRENNATMVISFDSLDEGTYGKLTGTRGQFGKAVANIKNLIKAYEGTAERRGRMEILRVAINTTISSLNENEVHMRREFWGKSVYFICNPLGRAGRAAANWAGLVRGDEEHARQKKLAEEASESRGPLTLTGDGLCGYSAWGVAVGPCGEYMSCAYTNETEGLLGNVRERSLREAFEHKHQMEEMHYQDYGKAPCLMRAGSFGEYLASLRER